MYKRLFVFVLGVLMTGCFLNAETVKNLNQAREFGTESPSGFVDYCNRSYDELCGKPSGNTYVGTLAELETVNSQVNRSIKYVEDISHYKVWEYWTVPIDGKGDCEDYALAKAKALLAMGWSPKALRLASVKNTAAIDQYLSLNSRRYNSLNWGFGWQDNPLAVVPRAHDVMSVEEQSPSHVVLIVTIGDTHYLLDSKKKVKGVQLWDFNPMYVYKYIQIPNSAKWARFV